ncbi:MAG: MAE_28990/MAE_18760 family HEPN-like nuclease [Pirellulaceae bacterium]
MNEADFVAELDRELEWRSAEVRRLRNLITNDNDELARDELRKALVVLLYSHFEGFCVFALQHYRLAVNQEKMSCGVAIPAIVAGAWDQVFTAMQTGDEKCKVFLKVLPDDTKLHRHWRRRHFVEEVERLKTLSVEVPEDVIDAESNLKVSVLQRNLFVLGLDHQFVDPHVGSIQRLLKTRNDIAHGNRRKGVAELEYKELESAVNNICKKLIELLVESHRKQQFRLNPITYSAAASLPST